MEKTWTANYTLNIGEKVLYHFLYAVVYCISLLPFRLLYLLSDMLYVIVMSVGYRKDVVNKNLMNSFPEKSPEEINDIRKRFYHFLCDSVVETIKTASISRRSMQEHMQFEGIDIIKTAIENGHGVALYLGHYCNWEWVTSIRLALHFDIFGCQVYHVLESKVMDKLMLRLRSKMDTTNVPMAEIMRAIIREKQNGRLSVTGFISDQAPVIYSSPYWTTFLHQDTPFINGTERLVRKLNLEPVYVDIRVVRRGYYQCRLSLLADNVKELPEGEVTERYARALEQTIRRQPEYWLWTHNRWKRGRDDFFKANKI